MLSSDQLLRFYSMGFLVIEDFFNPNTLLKPTEDLLNDPIQYTHTTTKFVAEQDSQARNEYFLNSGDKIRFFYEKDSTISNPSTMNKIGSLNHNIKDIVFTN
jgi:phytanoyl-CoA hydroxylase